MGGDKVLLVDDSKLQRLQNEHALVKAGYEVLTAGDGEEALRVAREKLPDVIVLDLLLPKLSGSEVLRRLKSNAKTTEIPVIVLSGLSQRNAEKLMHDGAEAYFEKSALEIDKNSGKLAIAVETVLCRYRRRQQGFSMAVKGSHD
jgi:CheY-like chemotaxis protein